MKKATFLLVLFLISQNAISQSLIAVQNGGTPSFYSDLGNAIDNAVDGDTIYIPGRSYTLNKTINKRLHLVGTGINPNSTTATGITSISGSVDNVSQITLGDNADGSSITGISFTNICCGGASDQLSKFNIVTEDGAIVSDLIISRCVIQEGVEGVFENSLFYQNVILNAVIESTNADSIFTNNIVVADREHLFINCVVSNNIFLDGGSSSNVPRDGTAVNCLIENNILDFGFNWGGSGNFPFGSSNNFYRNNLNVINGTSGSNIYNSNFPPSIPLTTVFVNFSGAEYDAYNFTENFNLPDASPYKNAGADGTDIGIYGGRFPWKDGEAPFNPQIVFKDIEGNTDANGNIQVEIHVEAQGN